MKVKEMMKRNELWWQAYVAVLNSGAENAVAQQRADEALRNYNNKFPKQPVTRSIPSL